jgi:hypothetical protein
LSTHFTETAQYICLPSFKGHEKFTLFSMTLIIVKFKVM